MRTAAAFEGDRRIHEQLSVNERSVRTVPIDDPAQRGSLMQTADRPTHARIPLGTRLGIWLLWLCLGLPASAMFFLGVPVLLALFALEQLEEAGVPMEVWSELEPWAALLVLTGVINWWASFRHRALDRDRSGIALQQWLLLGGLSAAAWLGLFGIERIPRSELNPVLHYLALSAVVAWSSLTLAWWSGRALSLGFAAVERRAVVSGPLRGSLATAGPLTALGLVAAGTAAVAIDDERIIDGTRALVEGTFKDEWSIGEGGGGSGGSGRSRGGPGAPPLWFDECLSQIYAGDPSWWQQGVWRVDRYIGIDAESIAADAAIDVCMTNKPRDLKRYYFAAVQNGANSDYRRRRRLSECVRSPTDDFLLDKTRTDCVYELLCKLEKSDQDVLTHLLLGGTAQELADLEHIQLAAAEKRRTRARKTLAKRAREECAN
jgi:hypothetical protein